MTQEDLDTYLHRFQSWEPTEKLQELLDNCPEEENKIVKEQYNAFWGEVKGILISPISWRDICSYIDEGGLERLWSMLSLSLSKNNMTITIGASWIMSLECSLIKKTKQMQMS